MCDGIKDDIHIMASARSFLHTQVRSMVGALIAVGEGRWNADDVTRSLYARARSACAPVAPAEGLYLVKVDYDDEETGLEAMIAEDNSC